MDPGLQAFLNANGMASIKDILESQCIFNTSDLVYALINNEILNLLAPVISKLKRTLELRIEYEQRSGSITSGQEEFFNQYTTIPALQRTPWIQIKQSFKGKFDYDEKDIVKEIWASRSELRKSLLEAHLPFELADKMEKEGIRTIGAIPSIEFNKFSQGLKSNEEKTLQKMHYDENSSNQQQLRIREEAERKSLLEKIDKANQLIREN